jgi:dye decolorizing peroxidase
VSPLSRRRLLSGAAAIGLLGGCGSAQARQSGVATPQQFHCDVSVWDAAEVPRVAVSDSVTVTVGHGIDGLPEFPGDQVAPDHRGGKLLLQVCGDDPAAVEDAAARLAPGGLRWREKGFRTADNRNTLGFVDGIVVPKTPQELNEEVWLPDGSTIAVVRRMKIDVAAFTSLPVAEQERVFGRRKDSAVPLSGGEEVDLTAKTPDGEYLIPVDAHVRRAHPLPSGTGLMLRRSYNYAEGLIFISFQRELKTFVNTMYRMIEGDALLRYATTTTSAAFRIPPLS